MTDEGEPNTIIGWTILPKLTPAQEKEKANVQRRAAAFEFGTAPTVAFDPHDYDYDETYRGTGIPETAPAPRAPSRPTPPRYPQYHARAYHVPPPLAPVEVAPRAARGSAWMLGAQRLRFLKLTYLHLLVAIFAFAGLEYLLATNAFLVRVISTPLVGFALGARWNWVIVLAVFAAAAWVADYWASQVRSRALQYLGLAVYVVAEALIFVPLLAIVAYKTQIVIRDAAICTLAIFTGLSLSVFLTRYEMSFLRSGLATATSAASLLIAGSLAAGFSLGLVFSVAMVLLAAGYILFQTSEIQHYDPRNHVAAALALFASIALMFWYVIRLYSRRR